MEDLFHYYLPSDSEALWRTCFQAFSSTTRFRTYFSSPRFFKESRDSYVITYLLHLGLKTQDQIWLEVETMNDQLFPHE